MKTRLLILIGVFVLVLIPVATKSFAEESFDGHSSIDPSLSEITSGKSTVMNIRFLYTSGPYAMNNFTPIIEVNPSSVRKFVQIDVDSIEITQGQIKRIPVTLTIDPHIDHDKIFLSISFTGNHFMTDELQKSSWNDQVVLDVIVNDKLIPEPEPEQDRPIHENCGPGTTLQNGICVVDESQKATTDSSAKLGNPHQNIVSPLKQMQSGIEFHNVKCSEGLQLVYKKTDDTSACVTLFTKIELVVRGWATDSRVMLGCTGDRIQKCYPEDPTLHRNDLYEYYFGD